MKRSRLSTELNAGGVRPADLFRGDVQYRAPIFQRHYIWKEKQFEVLWSDFSLLGEEGGEVESRFLGALVLEDQGGGLATDPDEYLIVDGQQRLLTIYLVLIAVAERAHALGTARAKSFAIDMTRQWLVNQASKVADTAKVLPTLEDFSQFRSVMHSLSKFTTPSLPAPYGSVQGRLTAMFERIRGRLAIEMARAVQSLANEADEQQSDGVPSIDVEMELLEALAGTVLNKLKFVQIVLGDDDDPHHVFDRLNDAGIKLDVADLVRNDVFQRMAGDPSGARKLHENEWTPFEASLSGRLPQFIFPYALIKKPTTTKGRMMTDLREEWSGKAAPDVIADMGGFVPSFNALAWPTRTAKILKDLSPAFRLQVERLARMPIPASVYPYAMMVIRLTVADRLDESTATHDLLLVESFLVRRALAGFEPTGLHAVFKTMWHRTHGVPEKLLAEIQSRGTVQFPSDAEFEVDIRTGTLYGRRLANYVLAEYDRSLPGDPTPDLKPTIDHVMPRRLASAWNVNPDDHKRLLNVWANLVPLSGPGNSAKSNDSWASVRMRLLEESSFKTARGLALKYKDWGIEEIEHRSTELVAWALARWPRV